MKDITNKIKDGNWLFWRHQEEALSIRFHKTTGLFEVQQQNWTDTDTRHLNENELITFLKQRFLNPESALRFIKEENIE